MSRYDAAGNEYEPEDVLDAEELADYYAARGNRGRTYRPTRLQVFPALDEDGYDAEGYAWGAR